jgi:aromatic-L-amino-acid decarboxylase
MKSFDEQFEENLDPSDWEAMRKLGYLMIDNMLDYIQDLPNRPVWQHAPRDVKAFFDSPPPFESQPPEEVYEDYRKYILPYPIGNSHPRFWGWIAGTGTLIGAYADLLAGVTNTPSGAFAYLSPNYVEAQVLNWCKSLLGFPITSSGVLTSGCSAANLIGLAVARNTKAGFDLRKDGLRSAPKDMVIYASTEAHSSIQKAVELLGLGSRSLHLIPVDGSLRIDVAALRRLIIQDREVGYEPFCVVGAAGTTNTGAIDDLQNLADICESEGLWYHVDAAFGAWAAITPDSKHLVSGMERADSLAFDLHKWMYLPYDIGCILVKSEQAHRRSFSLTPTYLAHGEGLRGMTGVDIPWLSDYTFQLSRSFRALKAWMTIKEHGVNKIARLIQQNIDQANYLAALVDEAHELEMALPVSLNVACFRYKRSGLDDNNLNKLNKQIEIELHENGVAVPSIVLIDGRNYLHVAVTNHRSRREDFQRLVSETIRIGDELAIRTAEGKQ